MITIYGRITLDSTPSYRCLCGAAPTPRWCLHHASGSQCLQGCADVSFVSQGMDSHGACPALYARDVASYAVTQCAEGGTNVKFCHGNDRVRVQFQRKDVLAIRGLASVQGYSTGAAYSAVQSEWQASLAEVCDSDDSTHRVPAY